jgi:hypothetical protein
MTATLLTVLAALAAAFTLALVAGTLRWKFGTRKLRDELEATLLPIQPQIYSVNELAGLPAPVQRYFRAALVDGLRIVAGVALEQTGTFNQSETTPAWKPFTAKQRVVTRRPGYVWDARIAMFPGVPVRVRDAYVAGEGILQAAVLGLFPVANLRDSGELAKGELMRYFAEMAWYPTALLPSQGVRWEAVDEHSARATLRDGAVTVALIFRFDADDLIEGVRAEARGRMVGAKVEHLPWEGRFWSYAARAGMHVPLEGEVSWMHPEGPKPYWRGRITRLNYEFAGGV